MNSRIEVWPFTGSTLKVHDTTYIQTQKPNKEKVQFTAVS